MGSFTIHSVDEELNRRLREEATRRKTSKNRLVKELLERSLGLRTGGNLHDDYREFCGVWNDEERKAFDGRQRENARIDPEQWS
jgi:predicted HicB family RNase H-like nuclease